MTRTLLRSLTVTAALTLAGSAYLAEPASAAPPPITKPAQPTADRTGWVPRTPLRFRAVRKAKAEPRARTDARHYPRAPIHFKHARVAAR